MKKKLCSNICLLFLAAITLCACGKQGNPVVLPDREEKEPFVVSAYEVTDSDTAFEDDELVTIVKYYEMSDGTWKTDTHTYQYRLEITGRMGGANKDSTFVFLSNTENITFEQAWKAAGFSSNSNDYFKEEDAIFVALK